MPVILHFVAEWSGPTRPQRLEVAEAASALGLEVIEVDIDQDQETPMRFGVQSVPTVALLSDGNDLLNIVVGSTPAGELVAQFLPHVS